MKVRFVHLRRNVDKTVSYSPPARIEQIDEWLRKARKLIPEIPEAGAGKPWKIGKKNATPSLVVFELNNGLDPHTKAYDFCHVVINRLASSLG